MADHTDAFGYPLAEQPHPDAYFDPAWRSRYSPKPMDGWRLGIRCKAGCEDGVGSMAATHTLTSDDRCPICAGPIEMFNRVAEACLAEALDACLVQMRIWVSINGDMVGALQEKIAAGEAALALARGETSRADPSEAN